MHFYVTTGQKPVYYSPIITRSGFVQDLLVLVLGHAKRFFFIRGWDNSGNLTGGGRPLDAYGITTRLFAWYSTVNGGLCVWSVGGQP